jgi:hypothetical protein
MHRAKTRNDRQRVAADLGWQLLVRMDLAPQDAEGSQRWQKLGHASISAAHTTPRLPAYQLEHAWRTSDTAACG